MSEQVLSPKEMQEIASLVVELNDETTDRKIAEKLHELDSMERADLKASDERVAALETQIDELQGTIDKNKADHAEEIRLFKTQYASVGGEIVPQRAEGGPVDPMRIDWQGQIMRGAVMAEIVHQLSETPEIVPERLMAERAATSDFGSLTPTLEVLSGKMPPEALDRFIDLIVEETASISQYTVRRMSSNEMKLDRIEIAARTIRTPTEGADAGHGAADLSFPARQMRTVEVSFIEDITLSFLEDNIMKANAEAQIASALARQFGTDLNDLGVNGRASGPVVGGDADFLNLNEGWYSIIEADTPAPQKIALNGATTATEVLRLLHRNLPPRFLSRNDYIFHVPPVTAQLYVEEVSDRETAMGDATLIQGMPAARYFGRQVYMEPAMQVNTATSGSLDTSGYAVLIPRAVPQFGVQRNMRMDAEWRPRKRAVEYTVTARVDYEIADVQTHTFGDDVPAPLR